MAHLATRITYNTLAAARTIASGQSITVFGILLTNTTGAAVDITITDAASTPNTLAVVTVPADSSVTVINGDPVLFDKGLIIGIESSDSHVTVFHSQVGI